MKLLNNLIAWLYIMGTIVLGIVLILSVSGWYGIKTNLELTINEQLNSPAGILTGLVLILIGLLFLAIRYKAGKGERSISFDNPEGEVTISIKAIEDFVKRVGQEFSQVIEMTPAILAAKDGIKIRVKTALVAGSNIPRLAESIQHTIKTRMQNILGIENITMVEVNVSKLITKPGVTEETAQQTLDLG